MKKKELLAVVVLALVLVVWALWPKSPGSEVLVTVDGETVLTLDLSQDGAFPLEGYGGFSLTVLVEDGRVCAAESTCPDLICQNHVPISGSGEQIVCLPGRIVIQITGQEGNVDAATG